MLLAFNPATATASLVPQKKCALGDLENLAHEARNTVLIAKVLVTDALRESVPDEHGLLHFALEHDDVEAVLAAIDMASQATKNLTHKCLNLLGNELKGRAKIAAYTG